MTSQEITDKLTADGWSIETTCTDPGGYNKESVYTVTLRRNGRKMSVEYRQGCGHRVWKSRGPWGSAHPVYADYWAEFRKPGRRVQIPYNLTMPADCPPESRARQQAVIDAFDGMTAPTVPTLADVLYCLVADAGSVRYGSDFADWAQEFGYDEDSRKAHKAFKGCVREWRGLVRLGADFDQLDELFQDF